MVDALQYVLAGVVVGLCVGVTGVGGGSLMTPILISLFRIEPNIAIGTDLLYASISKFCGSMVHARKLNIVWGLVLMLALGSIPASFATTWMIEHVLSQSKHFKAILTMFLGFMLTLTGISIIFRSRIEQFFARRRQGQLTGQQPDALADVETIKTLVRQKRVQIILMGVVLGVFVTLSSVGAGAFGIMALVLMFPNLPMIRIIGSDVAHAVGLTLVAGLGHLAGGNVDFHLLMWLLVGSIPAIIVGTLISSRLPERIIRRILGVTLLALGINFMVNPTKTKPKPVAQPVQAVQHQTTNQPHTAATGLPAAR